jgi:hypothetical protein
MLAAQQNPKTSGFELRLSEAGICHTMGLFNEALSIYQQTLKLIPDHDKNSLNFIQNKIDQIQKELANLDDSKGQEISADDVVTIKNSMTHDAYAASTVDKFESIVSEEDQHKRMQKGERYKLPVKMSLEIYPKTSFNYPIIVEGYSKDISISGTCVVLNEKNMDVHSSIASFHKSTKDAKVKLSMSIEALKLKVSGNIVRTQKISINGKQTLALEIKFDEMSPKFQGMLFAFADNLGVLKKPIHNEKI